MSPEAKWTLFADDLLLHKPISYPSDFLAIQDDITEIEKWSTDNILTLNPLKCKYMVVSRKRTPSVPGTPLILNDHSLSHVDFSHWFTIQPRNRGCAV